MSDEERAGLVKQVCEQDGVWALFYLPFEVENGMHHYQTFRPAR